METLLQLLLPVALLCVIDRTMLIFEEFAQFLVSWIEMNFSYKLLVMWNAFPWQWFTVYNCFVRSALMLRYGIANEESFQSLSEETTSDLSANVKNGERSRRKLQTCEIKRMVRRGGEALIKLLEERLDFVKYPFSPLRFIQCLAFPPFVTLSSSSSNISSRVRAAKHLLTVDGSRGSF